jgi:hypothetical protein
VNLMVGSDDLQKLRAVLDPLEGLPPLKKFVLIYANVNPNGDCLTPSINTLEAALFTVWLEACESLGLSTADPRREAQRPPHVE